MKKYSYLFVALILSFCACDKNDSENNNPEPTPQPEPEQPTVYSEIGVWESGKYFIALSEDHTISAYVAPNFIDGGMYSISDDKVITCKNTFYVRTTTYTIESIDDKNMKVKINYMGNDGTESVTTLNLTKSDKEAPSLNNPLVGKSFTYLTTTFGKITYSFNVDGMGLKMCTKSPASNYPLKAFYVTLEDRCYYMCYNQENGRVPLIGEWNNEESLNNLKVFKFKFGDGGTISDLEDVSNEYL
ncbi:MAG: hypothetical protein J6W13_11825 [Salinivirgaceae bacterium]|nr:hypothetical protein [Salinivirgaceae bacterium]